VVEDRLRSGFRDKGGSAMTRVLVVHHDIDVADIQADELRRAGYDVDQCVGPFGGTPCPVMSGQPCWQVEAADVVLYDAWAYQGRPELIEDLRAVHPDKPVVISSGGLMLDWEADATAAVTPVNAGPNQGLLARAVEVAAHRPQAPLSPDRQSQSAVGARW
jgi:hypothetical protein